MPHELPYTYEPGAIETLWAEYWLREKVFHVETPAASPQGLKPQSIEGLGGTAKAVPFPKPSGDAPSVRPVFTLLLPPPNVTGRLHMGHMLNQTQMDILVRWHRMRACLTLWLPRTGH